MFPKRNPINPIIFARWTGSAQSLVRKSTVTSSILVRSMSRLAGSTAAEVPHGMVFFSYFISHFFAVILFEPANKLIITSGKTDISVDFERRSHRKQSKNNLWNNNRQLWLPDADCRWSLFEHRRLVAECRLSFSTLECRPQQSRVVGKLRRLSNVWGNCRQRFRRQSTVAIVARKLGRIWRDSRRFDDN